MIHLHCEGLLWNCAFVHNFSLYVQHMHNKLCIIVIKKNWTIYAKVHNNKWILCIPQLWIETKSIKRCSYLCCSACKLCNCALFWAIRTNKSREKFKVLWNAQGTKIQNSSGFSLVVLLNLDCLTLVLKVVGAGPCSQVIFTTLHCSQLYCAVMHCMKKKNTKQMVYRTQHL